MYYNLFTYKYNCIIKCVHIIYMYIYIVYYVIYKCVCVYAICTEYSIYCHT